MRRRGAKLFSAVVALVLVLACDVSAQQAEKTVCLACHSGQSGRGGRPVALWRNSIHARNDISCNHCHGGDPADSANAMSPARGFLGVPTETAIPAFCGRCHVGIRDDYLSSAHGRALGKGGPTCVTCHGSHDVRKVTLDIINEERCSTCHPYDRARAIKEAMAPNERRLVQLEAALLLLRGKGIDVSGQEKSLFAVKNRYHRLFHNVDVARVSAEASAISAELDKQQAFVTGKEREGHRRRVLGGGVVAFLLVVAFVCHLLKKSYD